MNVELKPIDSIKPYARNPRRNDAAVNAVASSITAYGFRQPIVVDKDGVIVCGHTRWKAAKQLGLTTVPVHVATELTEAQCKAYRLADNRTNQLAQWDPELLPIELGDLKSLGIDIGALGWNADELAEAMAPPPNAGLVDPDDVPAPPEKAVTTPGDLIRLGDNFLLCGDSARVEDVDRLLQGAEVHLVNSDPPYGVRVEPRSNNAISAGLSSFARPTNNHHQALDLARHPEKSKPTTRKMRPKDRPLHNDFLGEEEFSQLLHSWFANMARVMAPGASFYVWGGYSNLGNYPPALKANGLYFSQAIVWDKQHPVLSRKDYMGAFELCYYGWKEGRGHQFYGPNNVSDLWSVKKVNPQTMVHLTEKPVELAARAIEYSSKTGQHVLDLFGGSGSTLIAAEQSGRRAFLMELDPLYCDVIVQRWESFTGKKAERQCQSAA